MRYLIVVDDFAGGAGNMAQLLAEQLRDEGNNVYVSLTNQRSEPRYYLADIQLYNTPLSVNNNNKLIALKNMISTADSVIRKAMPDVIISFLNNNNTITCFALKKSNTPVIVCERSNPVVVSPKFPWNYLRRIAYKRADAVSVQFDCFKHFDGGRFEKRCFVTHNIIEKPTTKKEKWQGNKISFVSLARYNEIKRFGLMISLFSDLEKDNSNCELHIFGRGVVNDKLSSVITECHAENVFLHEAISNVHEELTKHDVYLMTSLQEGFPNALSEGLAVGLPAVVFKCHDGIADLVQNGVNGFCVDEGDNSAFVDGMKKLASDISLRKAFGAESINIADKYNKETVINEWHICIDSAITHRNRRLL